MMESFKKVIYSNSEEDFKLNNCGYKNLIDGMVLELPNSDPEPLKDYHIRNWESCSQMWVKYFRNSLETLGDATNNRNGLI